MRANLEELENLQQNMMTRAWEDERKLYEGIGKLRTDVKRLQGVVGHLGSTPTPLQMETLH